MIEMIIGMLKYDFAIRALICGGLISLCAAMLGVVLVLKRYALIGDGLSHVGFGALSIAMALNLAPMAVAIPVVIVAAFLLLRLSESSRMGGDAAIAVASTSALTVGVIVASLSKGMNVDVNTYMFGSLLAMTDADVMLSVCLCALVLALFFCTYRRIFAVTFDESFSRAIGVNAELYNTVIALLTAVTVVVGMRMMSTLLISSLIIFPALTAMQLCRRFASVMLVAALSALLCVGAGLVFSFALSIPAGASVVAANMVMFALFGLIRMVRAHR